MANLVGKTLRNRYQIQEFLGHGGMADVYKVYDTQRAVTLAIKVLHPELAQDESLLHRFSQEAEFLKLFRHPNIVPFYEGHTDQKTAFIVIEYVQGSNLRSLLKAQNRPLNVAEILQYIDPIITALHYTHQSQVFHCDIKPSNILIGQHGKVYLSDFGIARIAHDVSTLGTPTHMAPEQAGGKTVDARTDIYALGITLYELATGGKRPFNGTTPQALGATPNEKIAWEHANLPPTPPRQYNAFIPNNLDNLILRTLAKQPEDRFASVLEILRALEVIAPTNTLDLTTPIATSKAPTPPITTSKVPTPSPRTGTSPPSDLKVGLYVRVGDNAGKWFSINSEACLIGRSREANFYFSSTQVSRQHATITRNAAGYFIQDLGSMHGTFVNGRRVTTPRAIQSGDILRLGDVEVLFYCRVRS